jgi:hypothetical protein
MHMGLFQTTDLRKHLRRGSVWTGLRRPEEDQASKTLAELERQLLQSIDRLDWGESMDGNLFSKHTLPKLSRLTCNQKVAYYRRTWMRCSKLWPMKAVESCSMS